MNCVILCILQLFAVVSSSVTQVSVSTPTGKVIGSRHPTYERFGYLPYAQPPIGNLRWSAPKPMYRFPTGIHDGSRASYRPACPQPKKPLVDVGVSEDQDEDCLFLFIWRPVGTDKNSKLPVAVFTHGGAHFQGSGSDSYVNGESIAKQNVLLVTINYRLGWLGFMNDFVDQDSASSSKNNITSVAGALDNLEALRFVRRNIRSFGGDPNKVTLFGESAGASNCLFLLTSKSMVEKNEKLFRRIFIMSPAHLHFDVLTIDNNPPTLLSKLMNCSTTTTSDTWKCLRSKPWKEIWNKLPSQSASRVQYLMTLSPAFSGLAEVVGLQPKFKKNDNEWPTSPMKRMKNGQIAQNVDIVIGQTLDEGSLFTKLAFMISSTSDISFFKSMMYSALKEGNEKDTNNLMQHYLNLANQTSVWDAQVKFCGDVMFSVPVHLTLSTISKFSPNTNLYSYLFSYSPGVSFLGQNVGAAHGLELTFFFNALNQKGLYGVLGNTSMNQKVSSIAQNMFVNFANNGNSKCLKKYTLKERNFCEFTSNGELKELINYNKKSMDLWDQWMSSAPNGGWPSWNPKNEYKDEPIISWMLNQVLVTELILLSEDWKRMLIYGSLLFYVIWKVTCECCCGCFGCCKNRKEKDE